MTRLQMVIKATLGVMAWSALLYLLWNGSYFGVEWLIQHYHWQLSAYNAYLLVMVGHFVLLIVGAGIIAFATRGKERAFYIPIITAIRQISKGDFQVALQNDKRYGQFGEIVEGINEMASELSRMETMRQDFISNVSHEIQSPLTSIRGFARALRREDLSPETKRHYLDIIEAEGSRLSGLGDNLLKLSALEAESAPLEIKTYRLDRQLRDMILACEPQWLGKDIEVEAELEELAVPAVQDLLSQVWTNLLHNSIKFTPPGGHITVRLRRDGDSAEAEVCDTGIGIAEEDLPRIFERFYKADKARSASGGGSGLGLSLAKKIVDIHGGTISALSRPGEGTAVRVRLPLERRG
ncbi:sensor histidine kinase [Paenibacillus tepidiphilus]|uniref:sensor histidine kinase n=1 Tax=Paenibacillus tepidiphilus TaxID=2608683 RepID=UPI00123A70E0|nr:HAMP domain-containing sensor histidine kinase [Paenibacillus tepidiphilus]